MIKTFIGYSVVYLNKAPYLGLDRYLLRLNTSCQPALVDLAEATLFDEDTAAEEAKLHDTLAGAEHEAARVVPVYSETKRTLSGPQPLAAQLQEYLDQSLPAKKRTSPLFRHPHLPE